MSLKFDGRPEAISSSIPAPLVEDPGAALLSGSEFGANRVENVIGHLVDRIEVPLDPAQKGFVVGAIEALGTFAELHQDARALFEPAIQKLCSVYARTDNFDVNIAIIDSLKKIGIESGEVTSLLAQAKGNEHSTAIRTLAAQVLSDLSGKKTAA